MPTTAEVEARLRRAATACEPLVEDLLAEPPTERARPERRPRRAAWLAAAAVVAAVVATAGVAVTSTGDDPSDEVRATTPDTLFDPTPPTDPRAANPTLATPVTLPDGTEVVLDIPGPERWVRARSGVVIGVDGGDDIPVDLSEATGGQDWQVDQELDDRAAVVTWGDRRLLLIEVDGWIATAHLASDGGDLPDELVPRLAADLTFRVGPDGPVDVGGRGITVREVTTYLTVEGTFLRTAWLAASRADGAPHPVCVGDPPVSPLSRTQRCVTDEGVLLTASAAEAQALLPGVRARLGGRAEASAGGPQVPVSLADGTEVVLTIPAGGAWVVDAAVAWVAIDGVESDLGPLHVMLFAETALQSAARDGSTLEVLDDGLYLVTDPSGLRDLMVEGGGWTASLSLDNAAAPISDEVRARLERSWEVGGGAAGPNVLTATGLEVVEALTIVSATDPPVDRSNGDVDALYVTRYEEDDGEVAVDPTGPRAEAAAGDLTFEVSPPR